MKISDAFPSNYLKASDLGDAQPVVKIAQVKSEAIGRDKELKPVVYFDGKSKGLVLNKTNAKKITEIAGSDDTDDWAGVSVKLYATETEFSGETVECIRIKAPGAKAKPQPKPEPAAVPDFDPETDDAPF